MRSISSRTTSTLMLPASGSGASVITSGCIPRAMRLQAAHVPQASSASVVPFEPGHTLEHHVGTRLQAVERLRERHRGPPLPHAAAAGEQEAGRQRPPGNGAREETQRQPVADDVSEGHGSPKIKGIVAQQGIGRD